MRAARNRDMTTESNATRPDVNDAQSNLSESDFLRYEAEATRGAISATLLELKKASRQAVDPRIWIRRFPGSAAAIAASAGFAAAWAITRRRKSPSEATFNSTSNGRWREQATSPATGHGGGQSALAQIVAASAHWLAPVPRKKTHSWLDRLVPTQTASPHQVATGSAPRATGSASAPGATGSAGARGKQHGRNSRATSQLAGSWWQMIKQTVNDWLEDKAPRLGAALAYYTIFSLAPLLVIALAIAGMALGADAVRGELHGELQSMLGDAGAAGVEDMIAAASKPAEGTIATLVGVVVLLFGASGVFGQLQDALNTIWEVQPKPRGVWGTIKDRFFSFVMVIGTGFLLLVSLALSAAINLVAEWMGSLLPLPEFVLHALNFVASFAIITLLFAAMFKVIPDAVVEWKDVWVGAIVTAALFVIGKFFLGMYLGRGSVANAYGAAGALVVVLLWVYYSAQIVFLGAEFTQVYARSRGSRIKPADNAIPVTDEARAQQGMQPKTA
jgi:membrane protein